MIDESVTAVGICDLVGMVLKMESHSAIQKTEQHLT